MSSAEPLVSVVVPTLNRGNYVVRAVQSCIDAAERGPPLRLQVVVLDSQSDDGSWEELNRTFGNDARVQLVQNQRGRGPTQSWLDGAELVQGDYVTFLWSDDYVGADFFRELLPPLIDGSHVAIGGIVVRDVDCADEFPARTGEQWVEGADLVAAYAGAKVGYQPPVSPAAALFSRAAFDQWRSIVSDWCKSTELRNAVMWRRAIGPDLLLFLAAISMSAGPVRIGHKVVVQFSSHPDSITVSTNRWLLEFGYWSAVLWLLQHGRLTDGLRSSNSMFGAALVKGARILASAPSGDELTNGAKREVKGAMANLWESACSSHSATLLAMSAASDIWRRLAFALRRLSARGVR
jgi:glycosyltransferase involved in cell wall biosynthesis